MTARKPEELHLAMEILTWVLVGSVVAITIVLGVMFGGTPVWLVIPLVLLAGGWWWWRSSSPKRRGPEER